MDRVHVRVLHLRFSATALVEQLHSPSASYPKRSFEQRENPRKRSFEGSKWWNCENHRITWRHGDLLAHRRPSPANGIGDEAQLCQPAHQRCWYREDCVGMAGCEAKTNAQSGAHCVDSHVGETLVLDAD
jgi:hypothetical protein